MQCATEPELKARLEKDFRRLGDRCVWRKEVRLLCFTHASRGKADTLRIDYVLQLDEGPLLGVEVKEAPEKAADLGRALFQCTQYAAGIIGAATVDRVPPAWVGKPLLAVCLYTEWSAMRDYVRDHAISGHRLFGPANVGFWGREKYQGLKATLCADRLWSEQYGWHAGGLSKKTSRSGNGSFRAGEPAE